MLSKLFLQLLILSIALTYVYGGLKITGYSTGTCSGAPDSVLGGGHVDQNDENGTRIYINPLIIRGGDCQQIGWFTATKEPIYARGSCYEDGGVVTSLELEVYDDSSCIYGDEDVVKTVPNDNYCYDGSDSSNTRSAKVSSC
jgi:hypothetical protein